MKYKEFFEAYPWGGFDATKGDFDGEKQTGNTASDDPKDLAVRSVRVSDVVEEKDGPCWSGYEMIGWKMKDGKKVPNCVPVNELNRQKLDKPDQQDSDINNDGKVDATDDFIRKRRELSKRYKIAKASGTTKVNTSNLEEHELTEGEYCPRCLAEYIVRKKLGPLDEAEYQGHKVSLGKPMRGDVKKFKVYVRDPKTGNIKKVNFGDKTMKIKKSNPARRRSFRARHHCDTNPGPRTKARYWSCRKW